MDASAWQLFSSTGPATHEAMSTNGDARNKMCCVNDDAAALTNAVAAASGSLIGLLTV